MPRPTCMRPGLLGLCLTLSLPAQQATPAEQAWDAWRIAQFREPGQATALLALAASPDSDVQAAALDALIQTNARLTPAQLLALPHGHPDPRLILLAFAGLDAQPLLWDLLRDDLPTAHWLTALNLLFQERAAGLARHLLASWTVRATLVATDADRPFGMGGSGGAMAGCGGRGMRPGFPPRQFYAITSAGQPGDTLLTNGPMPTFFRRSLSPGVSESLLDRDHLRQRYLAALLGSSEFEFPLPWSSATPVVWRSLPAWNSAVSELIALRQGQFQHLVRLLSERGLLQPEEAGTLEIPLLLEFQDQRSAPAGVLPAPPKLALRPLI